MEPEYIEPLTNADVAHGDLLSGHVESGWRHLVRAYNTAKNARQYDAAGSIAYAIAETSAVMEYIQTMKAL